MILWDARMTQILPWHMELQILNFHSQNGAKMTLKSVTDIQFYRYSKPSLCLTAVSLQVVQMCSPSGPVGLPSEHQPGPDPPLQPGARKLMAPEQPQPWSLVI